MGIEERKGVIVMVQAGKMLEDMSLIELKALCYDLNAVREQNMLNIQAVNQRIKDLANKPVEVVKEEVK